MVANRIGHGGLDPFAKCVPATHLALKLRKLIYDQRLEVGFADPGGRLRGVGICADALRERARVRCDSTDFGADGSELRLKDYRIELREAVRQGRLEILFDEEARIRESGPKHAVIAFGDGRGVFCSVDDVEVGREELPAFRPPNGEVALVIAHHGDDHFVGQCEEGLVEPSRNDERFLDERDAFVR